MLIFLKKYLRKLQRKINLKFRNASILAYFYYLRNAFRKFCRKLRRRIQLASNIAQASKLHNLRLKYVKTLDSKQKHLKMAFLFWNITSKIRRQCARKALWILKAMFRLRDILSSLYLRIVRTALYRWRRRSRWPAVHAKFIRATCEPYIKKLIQCVVKSKLSCTLLHIACTKFKRFMFEKFVRIISQEICGSLILEVCYRRRGFTSIRRYFDRSLFTTFVLNRAVQYQRLRKLRYGFQRLQDMHSFDYVDAVHFCRRRILKVMLSRYLIHRNHNDNVLKALLHKIFRIKLLTLLSWWRECKRLRRRRGFMTFCFMSYQRTLWRRLKCRLRSNKMMFGSYAVGKKYWSSRIIYNALKFLHLCTQISRRQRLVRSLLHCVAAFRKIKLRMSTVSSIALLERRADLRFMFTSYTRALSSLRTYKITQKRLRLLWKTFRKSHRRDGYLKVSTLGVVFYAWKRLFTKCYNTLMLSVTYQHILELSRGRIAARFLLENWEHAWGLNSIVYFHLNRVLLKLASRRMIFRSPNCISQSKEETEIGLIKLKVAMRKLVRRLRKDIKENSNYFMMYRTTCFEAAAWATLRLKIYTFRCRIIFNAWLFSSQKRSKLCDQLLLKSLGKSYLQRWIVVAYERYILSCLNRKGKIKVITNLSSLAAKYHSKCKSDYKCFYSHGIEKNVKKSERSSLSVRYISNTSSPTHTGYLSNHTRVFKHHNRSETW